MTKKILSGKTGMLAFLLFIGVGTTAQSDFAEARWKKIDSLVKVLETAKDTTRVKALHKLSQILYHLDSDSAISIAHTAYDLAIRLNYLSEAANILNTISNRHFWRGDINESIDLGQKSISIYEKINNRVEAAKMYRELGLKLHFALRFSEALNSYDKAIHLLSTEKDNAVETSYCLEGKGDVFGILGKYDSAYLSFNRSLQVANDIKDPLTRTDEITSILISMAALFRGVGDMETFNYYRDQANMFKKEATTDFDDFEQAETNLYYQQFDSAHYYFFRSKKTDYRKLTMDEKLRKRSNYVDSMQLGKIYAGLKNYDSAIIYLEAALPYFIDQDRLNFRFEVLFALSISHFGNTNYQKALVHTNHLVQLSKKYELKPKLCDGYKLLSDIYEKTGDKDEANFYYRKYAELKDELKGDEFKQKLQLYKAEEREKQKQSSIEQLRKEKRWLTSGIILLAISIASFFGLVWMQRKYNAKKRLLQANELALKQAEDEKRIAAMEMLALRSQMNPHFIFNCLNSINRFVLRNDTESASNYLTKFSKLMRMVLENSKQVLIPLEEEVKCLELYIQMEQFRCKNSFTYYVRYHDGVNTEEAMIPPLLLQPFVENAIWHGVNPKEGDGKIGVEFFQKEEALYCVIKDNGIGRKKASELKSQLSEHHKSMGLQITKERLAIMGEEQSDGSPVEIEDLYDENSNASGTKVTIRIFSLPEFEELKPSLNL